MNSVITHTESLQTMNIRGNTDDKCTSYGGEKKTDFRPDQCLPGQLLYSTETVEL